METNPVSGRRFARSILATTVAKLHGSLCSRLLCSLTLALSLAGNLSAQSTGTLTGRVLEASSGNYLQGAEIVVEGSVLRATTERDGSFSLSSVPAGSYSVTATYPGLDPLSVQVEVKTGAAASASFSLTQGVIQLDRLVVRSTREGMAQAVALQKVSIQSKLVAAADQFGEVSEGNVGEYLKFLPGVTIDYNVNDARGVSLRGLSTAFTIVAVDGTPMAGASSIDDTRRFEFEQIAMNNVETTELFKTVTPDIAATSSGGFVNFITKSAFDHQDIQRFDYNVSLSVPSTNVSLSKEGGVWGHNTHYLVRPSIEMNYSRKLSDKWGINVNYRLSEKYDDSPRTEFTWVTTNTAPTIFTAPRLQTYNVRQEEKLTHRQAFAAKVDYILSDSTKLMFSGQWNWYDLNFTQRGPSYNLGTASTASNQNANNPSEIPLGTTYTSGTGSSITAGTLYRNKYGTTLHFNGRLTHEFANDSKLEITPYYSRSDGNYRDTSKGFVSATAIMALSATTPITSFSLTNPQLSGTLPTIVTYNGTTVVDPSVSRNIANYTLSNNGALTATGGTGGSNIQSRPWTAVDIKDGVRADYTYRLEGLKLPVTVMSGYELDKTKRTIDRPDYRPVITSVTGAALAALTDPLYTRDVALGYGSYPALDPYKVYDAFKGANWVLNAVDHRIFNETNNAAYVRADVKLTSNFLLLGGVRWEKREVDANAITGTPVRGRASTANIDFDSFYPSISFKYTPKRDIVVRGGFSQTIGIPDYGEMLPTFTAASLPTATDGSISIPSGNLKPYSINNYDLNLDYYLKNAGVITVSVFRKDISDYIIGRSMSSAEIAAALADYGFSAADYGISPQGTTRENGPKTRLQGVEFNYAQNMTFLPKPFDSLNIQANFTVTDISADDPDANRANDARLAQGRGVSPRTANLIIGYRYNKFSTTITTNWVSESEFGGFVNTGFTAGALNANPALDTRLVLFRDEKTTTDIKVEYAFSKRFSAYFLVRNVFNSPREDYARGYLPQYGNFTVPWRYYEFGEPHLTLGFKGRF
jgi:iron complex outermembrane receptor protein